MQDEEDLQHAFWGEAQSRPIYQERCATNDQACNRELEKVCACVLLVTIGRLWLDIMSMTTPNSREKVIRTVMCVRRR